LRIAHTRSSDLFTPPQAEAEDILLELADHIYANTGLKPMSKTLFAVSRLMLVVRNGHLGSAVDSESVVNAYEEVSARLSAPLVDDFRFAEVVKQCEGSLPRILRDLDRVSSLAEDADALGLVFNTLVRGKWDSGEGLGTFLTPEEVVDTVVGMVLERNKALAATDGPRLIGDICGGTGRFPFALARTLVQRGYDKVLLEDSPFSFDQSSMATNYARLNLHFMGLRGRCEVVADSLVAAEVTELRGCCAALATNPPFGAAKYEVTAVLKETLPPALIRRLINGGVGSKVDPSVLFLFRNLDLLGPGGVLGIVLPDGVIQSQLLVPALQDYELATGVGVEVEALVSLPSVTFSLGGTVAKTSFLVVSKQPAPESRPMFLADARHIGFLKRANRRVRDPNGSDLPRILDAYREGPEVPDAAAWTPNWRSWSRLGLLLKPEARQGQNASPLRDFVNPVRDYVVVSPDSNDDVHISVLDVDETGLINVLGAVRNRPTTRSLACVAGDVLISCINPRIWRVTVIPELPGRWTCSPEFLLVRPKSDVPPWELMLRLHHAGFKNVVQRMAGGTSSSRQRVDKHEVLSVAIPQIPLRAEEVAQHKLSREEYYRTRLREAKVYESLHEGHQERSVDSG